MKKAGILVLFFGLFILASFIVSAQYYSGGYGSYSGFSSGFGYYASYGPIWLEQNVGQYFAWFLGGEGDYLFERILLFFILIALLFTILNRMPLFKDKIGVNIVVTLAISLLISRFFGDMDYLRTILVPYSVLGIALTAAIPLIIYFFFVHSFEDSSTLRKILWVFFIVVFLGIWGTRASELGQASYIYLLTGIIAFILLLADGTIRRVMWKERMKQMGANTAEEAARKIRNQLDELHKDNLRHTISEDYYNREKRRLERSLKSLTKW